MTTMTLPLAPVRTGTDRRQDGDSTLAALTIIQGGAQRTWVHASLDGDPLIESWAATALLDGSVYRRLSMSAYEALRRG